MASNSVLKIRAFLKHNNIECLYCQKIITNNEDCTVDHVIPKSHGGSNHVDNLAIACKACNDKKGSLLLTQFIKAFDIIVTREIDKYL